MLIAADEEAMLAELEADSVADSVAESMAEFVAGSVVEMPASLEAVVW